MCGLFNKPNGCVWELGKDKLTQQEEGKGVLVGFGLFGLFVLVLVSGWMFLELIWVGLGRMKRLLLCAALGAGCGGRRLSCESSVCAFVVKLCECVRCELK